MRDGLYELLFKEKEIDINHNVVTKQNALDYFDVYHFIGANPGRGMEIKIILQKLMIRIIWNIYVVI